MQEDIIAFNIEPDAKTHAQEREHGDMRQRLVLQMLKQTRDTLTQVIHLLEDGDTSKAIRHMVNLLSQKRDLETEIEDSVGMRVVEGVFDGQAMMGQDGVRYLVPENYASKSKLVEGDMMKLIVKPGGIHVFKQIGPVDRKRLIGTLDIDTSTQEPVVLCDNTTYKVLSASVSYFKGIPGDECVILVPSSSTSSWAALERVNH